MLGRREDGASVLSSRHRDVEVLRVQRGREYLAEGGGEQPCWDGYSGWPGTPRSDCHGGSAVVSGLPSLSALRIAVIGRQNW